MIVRREVLEQVRRAIELAVGRYDQGDEIDLDGLVLCPVKPAAVLRRKAAMDLRYGDTFCYAGSFATYEVMSAAVGDPEDDSRVRLEVSDPLTGRIHAVRLRAREVVDLYREEPAKRRIATEADHDRLRAAAEAVVGVTRVRVDTYGNVDRKRDATVFVDGGDYDAVRKVVDAATPTGLRVSIDHAPEPYAKGPR